jgi:hypothetical protein
MGRAMMVMAMRRKFATENTVWSFPMTFERVEARRPCSRTVHKKTAYTMPLVGAHSPSLAMTITEQNMRAKP